MEFKSFSKITRFLDAKVTVTEKIDGTNALIAISGDEFKVGSRSRWITPEDDNYGFARWAYAHKEDLMALGDGYWFGEWWGSGIQRKYGMLVKVFSLFYLPKDGNLPQCCSLVPTLYEGTLGGWLEERVRYINGAESPAAKQFNVSFNKMEGAMLYLKDNSTRLKDIWDK